MRSTRIRSGESALRTIFWIFTLFVLGGAVSVGAVAVANTVTTLPSPKDANLRRLVDIRDARADILMADFNENSAEPASLATGQDEAIDEAAIADAPADPATSPAGEAGPAPEGATAVTVPTQRTARTDKPASGERPGPAAAKSVARAIRNSVLSDAQIAALKQRLRLSPGQEPYWPEIEASLRAVARQINEANRHAHGAAVPVDTSTPEVERLKNAAMPLLMQMRPDQKAEIVALARVIGMEKMVALL